MTTRNVPHSTRLILLTLTYCSFALVRSVSAQDQIDFSREILPILSDKCFVCHGPDAKELAEDMRRLDSFEAAIQKTETGRAIDPQAPERSLLLQRIYSADDPMPPADADKQLTPAEKRLLSEWVQQGGHYSVHWAFLSPTKQTPPDISEDDTVGVIDAFVGQHLADHGLSFAPPADRRTLARRAALLLTGLPPEPDQLEAFLADRSAQAWERLIDDLLASPRFGEHQARYWLDAVRYGDTHGLHLDNRRGIYPYRDWVVRAFNDNLPLDQFITWQLAGDLLPNPTLEQQIATGFVRLNPTTSEGGAIPAEFQAKNNFDRTETLGTVLLGITLTCARCHSHKYDPVSQTEYYQLLAFFNSTAERPLDGNKYDYPPSIRVPADQPAWNNWQLLKHRKQNLLNAVADILRSNADIPAGFRNAWEQNSDDNRFQLLIETEDVPRLSDLRTQAQQLAAAIQEAEKAFTTTLVAKDLATPRPTHVLRRGEYDKPVGEPLEPDVPAIMGKLPRNAPRNRLGLAQWLTSPDHPLVTRVLVNRFWQQIFGNGLVRTPEDFGVQGQQPTHPELLDWLAVDLRETGWDLKRLLKSMVMTRTFQQSSAWRTDLDDPENRLYARAASYRLDAEVLRDLGLWSSGLLDPHMGGEGIKPYQPAGMWLAMAHPASNTKKYERDHGSRLYRRSLYVYWKRTCPHPMMTLFDAPDREASCVRRSRTNTSLQSLGLLNETQRMEFARALAARLMKSCPDDNARLDSAFLMLTCREPYPAERTALLQLLNSALARYRKAPTEAQAFLATGDFRINDDPDPCLTAAWSQVTAVILASDPVIQLY